MSAPRERAPLVAISANFMGATWDRPFYLGKVLNYVERSLATWLRSGGAIPYMVADLGDPTMLEDAAERFDGLVLSGGADVSPRMYGEEPLRPEWSGDPDRDRFEVDLLAEFERRDKPVLGVCRGHQLLNVARGGSLYQDLVEQEVVRNPHRCAETYDRLAHDVAIHPGSWLHGLYGVEHAEINSIHHQGVKDLGRDLVPCAWSEGGRLVEAMVDPSKPFVASVQWHPEWMTPGDPAPRLDPTPIRDAFLTACRRI